MRKGFPQHDVTMSATQLPTPAATVRFPPEFITDKPVPWSSAPLTRWGRVTHICVGNQTIIGSNNGLSPCRRQAITWTNVGILLIGPLGTNFSELLIEIHTFSFKKIHLKMSSGKWRPFCFGLNVLNAHLIQERYGFAVPNNFSLMLNEYHCVHLIPYSETHCRRHLQTHLLNANVCAWIKISL